VRGGRGASREAGGPVVWWRHDKRGMHGKGPTQGLGAKGTRGAHVEHVAHVRDAGGVEAQRPVEGVRLLPSRREGMRCGGERCEPGGGRAWGVVARHTRGMHGEQARLKAWGPRARAERTQNMVFMLVTLEVSKLSGWLKALAYCRVEGRACDAGRGERCEPEAGGPVGLWWRHTRGMHGDRPDSRLGGQGHARSAPRTCGTWS